MSETTIDIIKELSKKDTNLSDVQNDSSLEDEEKRERIRGLRQNIDERKHYANHLFWFLVGHMILVFLILFFTGFVSFGFLLSDSVIIALITTTTANVLTMFYFVVKYLFNADK